MDKISQLRIRVMENRKNASDEIKTAVNACCQPSHIPEQPQRQNDKPHAGATATAIWHKVHYQRAQYGGQYGSDKAGAKIYSRWAGCLD